MGDVARHYRRFATPETVFLSIAAGKTLAFFSRQLGAEAAIVRAMPNTPAAIGRGITVACPNPYASAVQIALCDRLLAAAGEVAWVDDEALIDAVTAVSGSGPAYVFLLIECLAKAGIAAGLPADLAVRLARATVAGSGELARLSSEPAEVLRQNVTSPGGTTRAALDVLMAADGLETLMRKAVAAAAARSRELAE
jgi:pyrroline-5-carboxylate reductase